MLPGGRGNIAGVGSRVSATGAGGQPGLVSPHKPTRGQEAGEGSTVPTPGRAKKTVPTVQLYLFSIRNPPSMAGRPCGDTVNICEFVAELWEEASSVPAAFNSARMSYICFTRTSLFR